MLSGKMERYEERTSYSYYPTYQNQKTWADMYKEIEQAKRQAIAAGFSLGATVNLKSRNNHNVGKIVGFASTIKDGVDDFGEVNPICVNWGDSKYDIFYKVDELELVK